MSSCSPPDIEEKRKRVQEAIAEKGSILIAFSGGVDSSLLAVLATEALGDKCRCVLFDSPLVPRSAVTDAKDIACLHKLRFEIIILDQLSDARFRANPSDRCFWCKKISAVILKARAKELGINCVADGTNVSDTGEYRPGLVASTEEGIWHPFIEAGITKAEIREIARELMLGFHDKPSAACLSSRIPYGDEISEERLRMIEQAEECLHTAGFLQVRVRLHGTVARIEVHERELSRLLEIRKRVAGVFRTIGFSYVTIDIEGYRSGSMDEVL